MSTTTTRRKGRYAAMAAVAATAALALSACSSGTNSAESGASGGQSGSVAEPSGSFESGNTVYDEIVNLGPVADEATIAASEWATRVKESGVLKVGGTETSELFSKLDPATGKVIGFDAGMSQLLANYIFGDATKTTLTQVSVDTREELLVNGSVDVVIATYSVTPERLERIDFAGPYYSSASAILIKKDNADISGLESLAGKTVVTQAGSTGVPTIEEFIPDAEILALPDHAQAVEALKQGRADAYVIDQTLLLNAVLQNPELTIVGEPFGDEDLYGIGIQTDTDGQAFIDEFLEKIFSDGTWLALWHATIGEMTGVTTEPVAPAIGSAGN
ncbi:glutamate ABC transporter substrate-binding protein [Actinomyces minihominis]|uniref:glutamate ABC transporter substrate-binding protein n=1 Tax=Actinomyces minihominis TaxID=2002838 RepID=UPI000C072915|nr:glutamate ABC transporter substrate-binding protein [Actinomyces minihominis]